VQARTLDCDVVLFDTLEVMDTKPWWRFAVLSTSVFMRWLATRISWVGEGSWKE
jgi:hypothetical protein